MEFNQNKLYVTLFSIASTEIYSLNSQTSLTNRLALPVTLGSSWDWKVGLCEIRYTPSQRTIIQGGVIDVISDLHVLMHCYLITPQLVGSEITRLFRTIVCPSQLGKHLFMSFIIFLWKRRLYEYTHRIVILGPWSLFSLCRRCYSNIYESSITLSTH